ncbi:D-alanine--D-alanine ligase Ddl [Symmachiella macrocystis]|uniref:D-alanine--D-alanine ligase n=1 Tax=Symmachiella macrocystis TaxID=2527985 RepID=A0A5C6BA53_9PLAN|nr:D-alanine--D-alanine ligase [Symmachiella macrocystis]TWU09155.1 D-alanine--D-alanine ligase Ddl [Symmachiella macrocystis]
MTTFETQGLDPLTVAVLEGGESSERSISLESGAAVRAALAERGHKVIAIDPSEVDLSTYDWSGIDTAFIALHGFFGEDGQVQQILEDAEMPYTGSDPAAARLSFQKSAAKERFFQNYVPTPPYVLIHEGDTANGIMKKARSLGYPLAVKPDSQGSSLGVSVVQSPDELPEALTRCFHLEAFGLLEAGVLGSEWTVGIMDELMLPLIQVVPNRPFYDYQAKYADDTTEYQFEFDIPSDVVNSINQAARNAYDALKMQGIARIDLVLDRFNRPWVLEANSVPGMTSHSLVPKAAARIGISMGELCEQMLQRSLNAAPQS